MPKLFYTETRPLTGWRKLHDMARFYWWWWVNRFYMRLFFRLEISGEEWIPSSGSAILVSNHISYLDANIISAASPRKVSFMIAREWYEARLINWMCRFLGCIPVNRSGQDLGAVKSALKGLSQGFLLGCFPEGGISVDGNLQEGKQGVALIALRSGCPMIPVHLSGHCFQSLPATFFLPKKIHIRIGKPILLDGEDPKDRESLARVTRRITDAIQSLADQVEPH